MGKRKVFGNNPGLATVLGGAGFSSFDDEEPRGLGNMFGRNRTVLRDPGSPAFDDGGRQVLGNGFAHRAGLREAGEELRKRAVAGY